MTSVAENAIASRLLKRRCGCSPPRAIRRLRPARSSRRRASPSRCCTTTFRTRKGCWRRRSRTLSIRFTPGSGRSLRSRSTPRELLVELVWAHLDFCQEHKPLAPAVLRAVFRPRRSEEPGRSGQYTDVGHELLMPGRATARFDGGLVRPDCEEEFAMALHGMINIWVIASLNDEAELSYPLAAANRRRTCSSDIAST